MKLTSTSRSGLLWPYMGLSSLTKAAVIAVSGTIAQFSGESE